MDSKHVEALNKLFAIVVNPPSIKLEKNGDEHVIMIDGGALSIRNDKIEQKRIGGTIQVDGFTLDKSTYQASTQW